MVILQGHKGIPKLLWYASILDENMMKRFFSSGGRREERGEREEKRLILLFLSRDLYYLSWGSKLVIPLPLPPPLPCLDMQRSGTKEWKGKVYDVIVMELLGPRSIIVVDVILVVFTE
jgi:hypothetical protein